MFWCLELVPHGLERRRESGIADASRKILAIAEQEALELVDDGETGLLVPPDDECALADALGALLGDAARRAKMGQCAREKAVAEYSVEKIMSQTLEFYQSVLSR